MFKEQGIQKTGSVVMWVFSVMFYHQNPFLIVLVLFKDNNSGLGHRNVR